MHVRTLQACARKILQNDESGGRRPSCPFAAPIVHNVGRLNYSSLREIGAATADLWRVGETLGKQRAVLGTKYGASSEPVVIHDLQDARYCGSLVVGTPSDEMNVLYGTGSSNLWVPNSDCYDGTQVTISTTIANQTPASPTPAHSELSTVRVQCQASTPRTL